MIKPNTVSGEHKLLRVIGNPVQTIGDHIIKCPPTCPTHRFGLIYPPFLVGKLKDKIHDETGVWM